MLMNRVLVLILCASFCIGCQPTVQKTQGKKGTAIEIDGRSYDEVFLAEKRRGLKHEDAAVRVQTIDSLIKEGSGLCGHFRGDLVRLLDDSQPKVRGKAAAALGRAGDRARQAVEPLQKRLNDDAVEVRVQTAMALWEVQQSAEGLPVLMEALKDANGEPFRAEALEALQRMGPVADKALPLLVSAAKEATPHRAKAVRAVGRVAARAKEDPALMNLLLEALRDKDKAVCNAAALSLGDLARSAVATREQIVVALAEAFQDRAVSSSAGQALERFGKDAVPGLLRVLRTGDATGRVDAVRILGQIGPEAKEAVGELAEALKAKDGRLRGAAAEALGRIGPDAKSAVPKLIGLFGDHFELRDPGAPGVGLPSAGREKTVHDQAVQAIGRIGREAVPALIEGLRHQKDHVRRGAAEALGRKGPDARDAVAALLRASRDENEQVRTSAMEALKKIDPEEVARQSIR
jgi:HEAT repeat protein